MRNIILQTIKDNIAYDRGHSSGFYEIEAQLIDMLELYEMYKAK